MRAAFGAPDIKGNSLAPYINGELLNTSAHAERYFNPPGNHPSQPNYSWLEAGTNFGVLADTQPGTRSWIRRNTWSSFWKMRAFLGEPTPSRISAARSSMFARST